MAASPTSKRFPDWRLPAFSPRSAILPACSIALLWSLLLAGCGAINAGKYLGIQKTRPDEHYWLLKEIHLSSGSSTPKTSFDHNINPVINLWFTLANEKNKYVAESRWIDPAGDEFLTIRKTYDIQQEGKKQVDPRDRFKGTPRVQTVSTQKLYAHKPGLWKVLLYIDGELARRLEFSVR